MSKVSRAVAEKKCTQARRKNGNERKKEMEQPKTILIVMFNKISKYLFEYFCVYIRLHFYSFHFSFVIE